AGVSDELMRHIEACRRIDFQSELRQLDGNVRVEFAAGDLVEQSVISGCGAAGLIEVVDMFAEDIERRAYPSLVQSGDDAKRFVNRFSCDVPVGNSSDDSFRNQRQGTSNGSVQESHNIILASGPPSRSLRYIASRPFCYWPVLPRL